MTFAIPRRTLLGAAAAAPALAVPGVLSAQVPLRLTARAGTAPLRGEGPAPTAIWGYDGRVPGPILRARQGERFVVEFENKLPQPTTIHWHGVRVPFAMDGVPDLTQKAIPPGGRFVYDFVPPDAGTFWYHPHANSAEQLGRGLAGALIVEEREAPAVDRDIAWLLSDWKLDANGAIDPDFKNRHEAEHEGRLGQLATVDGQPARGLLVRRNERVRLRLVNVANARIFELDLDGADPWLIALDGNPVPPRRLGKATFRLGPGMRADLLLDGDWRAAATLRFHPPAQAPRPLATFLISREAPLRDAPPPPPAPLPANPIAEPDLGAAERIAIVFGGGGGGAMQHGRHGGHHGPANEPIWTVNGKREAMHDQHRGAPPLFTLKRGAGYVAALKNDTSFDHPIHLHGLSFRTVSRNGKPEAARHFTDTILMAQQETAEIAFVADNPGDWMIHCHILEHQDTGMSAILRVA